jgi:GntR family transcriptional repressor for pyruvate dehydrogenase complex
MDCDRGQQQSWENLDDLFKTLSYYQTIVKQRKPAFANRLVRLHNDESATMPLKKTGQLKLKPILKKSISDDIVAQIINLISSGELAPGERLPSERDLCIRFGAGRSSLREGLRCLSIMGVLTARVGDGTSVAVDGSKFLDTVLQWRMSMEQHNIEDLMKVRIALEGLSSAEAATHGDDTDLKALQTLIAKMEGAVEDPRRFSALDSEFHLSLARVSKNKLLFDLISLIRGQLERGVARVLRSPDAIPLSVMEHRDIIAPIVARNPQKARAAMETHLSAAVLRYRKSSQSNGRATSLASNTPHLSASRKG